MVTLSLEARVLLSLAWCTVVFSEPIRRKASSSTPNFIVMQPDDFEFFEAWNPPAHFNANQVVTYPPGSDLPNINILRERGVEFSRAYAASTVCGTSRYSTITGRLPSRAATSRNRNAGREISQVTIPTTKLADSTTVEDGMDCASANAAVAFQANGYATGVVGKWHLSNDRGDDYIYENVQEQIRTCGFDFAEAIYKENISGSWAIDVTHNMEHVTAKAIEFIQDSVAADKPFFLYLNPTVPHGSGDVTDALNFADCRETVEGVLEDEPFIPFGMTADYNGCSEYRQSVLDRGGDDDKQVGAVWVDDAVGSVLLTLESLGELSNTFFLFQLDHGQEGKGSLYEPGARIAQFVHYPDWIAPGSKFDGVVSTIDIVPTMLDFAGIEAGYGLDGKSWKDEVINQNSDWSEDRCLFLELDYDRSVICGCHKFLSILDPSDRGLSGTVAKSIRQDYTLSNGNYFDLCDNSRMYISTPNIGLEQDGTISGGDLSVVTALQDIVDCYLDKTDPDTVPEYLHCTNPLASVPSVAPIASPTSDNPMTPLPSVTPPTPGPTKFPSSEPTRLPTRLPSHQPTTTPSDRLTPIPSFEPTSEPSISPVTPLPSVTPPTPGPTKFPSPEPTRLPSHQPTTTPSDRITPIPSFEPTPEPSISPMTPLPSVSPPTAGPTKFPSPEPTSLPSHQPTTMAPSDRITTIPSFEPTSEPSIFPSHTSDSTQTSSPASQMLPSTSSPTPPPSPATVSPSPANQTPPPPTADPSNHASSASPSPQTTIPMTTLPSVTPPTPGPEPTSLPSHEPTATTRSDRITTIPPFEPTSEPFILPSTEPAASASNASMAALPTKNLFQVGLVVYGCLIHLFI